jgi:sulfate/thiosulfate transport system substrate-binding protein
MRRAAVALVGLALVAASAVAAATYDTRLTLVAYSTPREAYAEIIPAFAKTQAGKDVSFSQSYGSSGEQARAVAAGLDADVVALSLAPDVDSLVKAGLVDAKWDRQSYRGIVHRSVVVFVVRDGNPKRIKGWSDLLRSDVEVIRTTS